MPPGSLSRLLDPVRTAAGRQLGPGPSDAELLDRFVRHRDPAAFELLVWRHDRLVHAVCRGVLASEADAADAWQATFLTLACKAGAVGSGPALGAWLYRVAFRIAVRARAEAARRGRAERAAARPTPHSPGPEPVAEAGLREARAIVAEEISRLPEKFRTPVVLCYLEGKTNEEAARQLGCPTGTVVTRLARARARLEGRLALRGVTAAALAAVLAESGLGSAAPPELLRATVAAAIPFAADRAAAGLVSARVTSLTKGALRAMLMNRTQLVAATLVGLCLVGGGSGLLALGARADGPNPPGPGPDLAAVSRPEADDPPAKDRKKERPPAAPNRDGKARAEEVVTKSFKTGQSPGVVLDVFNGPITIVADATGSVEARLTKQSQADTEAEAQEGLKNIDVEMKEDKDKVHITARRRDKDRRGNESVAAEVRVPAGAVLELRTSNGEVRVAGGTGGVTVQTSNGAIHVKDARGALRLTSLNGEIAVTGATGRAELKTSNGAIDLQGEKAVVTAKSSNGGVRFRGTLADGSHSFTTDNGHIALVLPADARFKLDARTSLGGIRTDFGAGKSPRVGGAHVQTTVGDDPKVTLTLETQNGGIEIRKRKE